MEFKPSILKGIVLMLGADVAFAIMAAMAKFSGKTIPAAQIVFVRSLISAIVLSVVLFLKKIPIMGREPKLLLARGIVGYIALQCYFWSLPQIELATAIMLNYTAPIAAVLASYFFIGERPSTTSKWALALSFLGVFLLTAPQFLGKPVAILAGLISGILAGLVHVMIRQSNQTDDPFLIIFYFTVVCTIGSGLLTLKSGFINPSSQEWAGLFIITVSSMLGQICLTHSLQKAPVWVVSPFGYLTPVLGALIGAFLWQEIPSWLSIGGASLIILSGTALLAHYQNKGMKI